MTRLVNNRKTTLEGAIDGSQTTITVDNGSIFQTGDIIGCENEIMLVEAVIGDDLEVERGYETSGATTHADEKKVAIIVTAKTLRNLFSDYNLIGTFDDRPAAGYAGRRYTYTNCPWFTHAIDDGTNWINYHNTIKCELPDTSGFSWYQQGNATETLDRDTLYYPATSDSYSTVIFRGTNFPSVPFTFTLGLVYEVKNSMYYSIGLAHRLSTNQYLGLFGPVWKNGYPYNAGLRYTLWQDDGYQGEAGNGQDLKYLFFRMLHPSSGNNFYQVSFNGITYFNWYDGGVENAWDQLGLAWNYSNSDASQYMRVFHWKLET